MRIAEASKQLWGNGSLVSSKLVGDDLESMNGL
jgi:hypothetical protein